MRTFIKAVTGMVLVAGALFVTAATKAEDSPSKKGHPKKSLQSKEVTMICDSTVDYVKGKPVKLHLRHCQPILEEGTQDAALPLENQSTI